VRFRPTCDGHTNFLRPRPYRRRLPAVAISRLSTPKFTATGGPDEAAMGKRLLWTIHAGKCRERARLVPGGNGPRGGGTDSRHSPQRTARCIFISV
jgi:hypothetical protein